MDPTLLSSADLLVQLVKKYERGDLPKSDWLDKLAFRKMEEIHAVSCRLYSKFNTLLKCTSNIG